MRKPIPRRQTFEIQAGADALLTPGGGGIAVWVRRDELEPRAAVRFSTAAQDGEEIDYVKIAIILATLRIGIDRVEHAMADQMNMPREALASMAAAALEDLRPRFELTTNIVRDGHKERA